ncbi:putative myosin heavy chain [Trypanosoma cruzi]|nr:putative myosin heavy chain [Trypanosoma cruzi]
MDSPFKSGSKEKEKSSSSSGGDHHFLFSSLYSLITQTRGVQKSLSHKIVLQLASLQPAASIHPKEHTRKPQIAMGKKEKNNKRSHSISTEAERHAFRTSSRKVGQSKRDPGPNKLGRHRRLLCSVETFQPAPVPPEGRGLAECDPRRKELLRRGPTKQILAYCGCQVGRPIAFPRHYRSAAHARLFTYPVVPQEAFPQGSSNAVDA